LKKLKTLSCIILTFTLIFSTFNISAFAEPENDAYEEPGYFDTTEESAEIFEIPYVDDTFILDAVVMRPNIAEAELNGQTIIIPAAPFIIDGTTMIPVRFICQDILNASVSWDNALKLTTIKNGQYTVYMDLSAGTVAKDGVDYEMRLPPVNKNGATFIPLRLIAELFGCSVNWNQTERTITIIPPLPPIEEIEIKPVGNFTLIEGLIAGQSLTPEYVITSYFDELSHPMTDERWEITDPSGIITTFKDIFSFKPVAGTYTVSYTVKNSENIWSDPIIKSFTVLPNLPPTVTSLNLTNGRTTVNIGEDLDFDYTFTNENWEKISDVRWKYTYKKPNATETNEKIGKPRAFFANTVYSVSLELKDAYGNWSTPFILEVNVSSTVIISEFMYKFKNIFEGEPILNDKGQNFNLLTTAKTTEYSAGGYTLIKSNNPEKVPSRGILYRTAGQGSFRIHYGHTNDSGENIKISAVIKNCSPYPVEIIVKKVVQAGPSTDFMQVGVTLLNNYFSAPENDIKIELQPEEYYLINPNCPSIKNGQSMTGWMDVVVLGIVDINIVAMGIDDPINAYESMSLFKRTGSQTRGSFLNADITVRVQAPEREMQKIIIGRSDASINHFLRGFDTNDGFSTTNIGNYGVIFNIHITAGKERIGVFINPRGSRHRGVLIFGDKVISVSTAGVLRGNMEGAVLGIIEPYESKTIKYTTPGASDSPVLFILVPETFW